MRVSDQFSNEDFEDLLAKAARLAKTTWEENFVSDLQKRWDQYEEDMLLSEKQLAVLTRISESIPG